MSTKQPNDHNKMISTINLFRELRRLRKIAGKRHPMYDQNKFAKYFMGFAVALWVVYLIMFGFLFIGLFSEIFPSMEPYHMLNKGMLYLLMVDFLMRFTMTKLPVQEIKPFVLLPVGKNRVLRSYLVMTGLSGYNLIWMFMLVPFAFGTLFRYFGFVGVLGFLVGYWLLMLANNYWFVFCRTLMNQHILYVLVPIAVYALLLVGLLVPETNYIGNFCMELGEGFFLWEWQAYLGVIALVYGLFELCHALQKRVVYKELSKTEVVKKLKKVSEYKFLDRFGEVGEYMRLEIKLLTRNKVPRAQFYMGFAIMLMFSALLAFTDVYDGDFMRYFITVYNFAVLGVLVLSQTMSYEGNYLDGLMSRKESILNLLRAKYYVQCALLCIPLVIMILPITEGKISLLCALACFFLTSGFTFWTLMQLAVYNKHTLDLNTKVTGKNSGGTFFQTMIIMAGFFLPVIILQVLTSLCSENTALLTILGIGLAFTLTHPLWMRNIYKRFMKRRYENMEGFRSSIVNN